MAHSKGLFYIREEAYGFMVVEVLIDKVNNCMAFSCTVPKYLKKILEEVVEEETFTSGWICFNNLDQKLVEEVRVR